MRGRTSDVNRERGTVILESFDLSHMKRGELCHDRCMDLLLTGGIKLMLELFKA